MKLHPVLLTAVAAAVTATSVASAGPAAAKQRVQIDTRFPGKTFALTALESGALEPDSGTHGCKGEYMKGAVLRDGQEGWPWTCSAWVLTGKRGTLVLRSTYTWIEAGGPYNVATGTWKVVRGTGQYARLTGGGRSARVGTASTERARYQGYLAAP
jgi:hypothetical protein